MSYGIDPELQYTELTLDSPDTNNTGNSQGTPNNWPFYYFTSKTYDMAAIKVLSAEIPNVFDTINTVNNTFVYNDGTSHTLTIPTGNPTGTQLAAQLQTAISAITVGFTVTWDSQTLRFTFTQPLAITWGFGFPNRNTMYNIMGFSAVSTYTQTGAGSAIVSDNVAIVSGPYYLNLNSRVAGPYVACNGADGSVGGGFSPTLARIPITVNKGSVIFYVDPNPTMWFDFLRSDFQYLDFYLTLGGDQNQVPLDMKGVPWSLKLGILTHRNKQKGTVRQ